VLGRQRPAERDDPADDRDGEHDSEEDRGLDDRVLVRHAAGLAGAGCGGGVEALDVGLLAGAGRLGSRGRQRGGVPALRAPRLLREVGVVESGAGHCCGHTPDLWGRAFALLSQRSAATLCLGCVPADLSASSYPVAMPVIIGHRGAPGYRPEHTRSSYELAIEQGADAVEPDVVATRDGVLVVRHENEISGTTDVADRPEFAHLRTVKEFAGHTVEGWFTEDFTWAELQTLRSRERIPDLRPDSAAFDGAERILSLPDVLDVARAGGVGVVIEIKHAPYFASIGIDLAELVARDVRAAGWQGEGAPGALIVESFEEQALRGVRERGIDARYVYLVERKGTAVDLLLERGS